ncbi:MAG: ArsR family transcriptional regulator [Candidatus Eisenbacteria bacterium RBG_16_71_46]|nr:MAG: ArsR family transcriptional regulator [Candidatus Eisenbacteria bacterium RBG_16_71_46]OGF24308.1 MAG: ArsR family transcriptional regulator [Candidatus Eisenbacteria bacterium RBG_19FT_COMBO_70_11]
MDRAEGTQRLFEHFAHIGKAVASPQRIHLLELLAQGERSVEVLAAEAQLPMANTSHHLQALRGARLVDVRRQGTRVFYRLAGSEVFDLVQTIRRVAQARISEVDDLIQTVFRSPEKLEPVSRRELTKRVREKSVLILDVRPPEEYEAGHISGAVSVPLKELKRRLARLPKRKEIVAYCRGPYCVLSVHAVELLRSRGFRARRLADGFPEWRGAGLPTASGPSRGA